MNQYISDSPARPTLIIAPRTLSGNGQWVSELRAISKRFRINIYFGDSRERLDGQEAKFILPLRKGTLVWSSLFSQNDFPTNVPA